MYRKKALAFDSVSLAPDDNGNRSEHGVLLVHRLSKRK